MMVAIYVLRETQEKIIELIKENNKITQMEMSDKLGINTSTVNRNMLDLKE